MSNQRQIPFLHWHRNANGTETAWWKPSPRLRRLGWTNRKLGTRADQDQVTLAALAINRQLAEWQAARSGDAPRQVPRVPRFAGLLQAYRASPDYAGLKPATVREYEVRLRFLNAWALDGQLELPALDAQMARDLKSALLANNGSKHRAASTLRVLRLLLNWAVAQGWMTSNPADRVKIPGVPSRITLLTVDEVQAAAAAATTLGFPAVALAFTLGLWSLQREADLLPLTRMSWRRFEAINAADAALLANPKGHVMGFRLQQGKTGKWVDCPIPPNLHPMIEAAFDRGQFLLPDDRDPARACPDYLLQRRARAALIAAGLPHAQFRDLRRSGITMLSQLGADLPGITAISGHMVMGRKTILDTYMPGNTRSACAAMATALRTLAARTQTDQANA